MSEMQNLIFNLPRSPLELDDLKSLADFRAKLFPRRDDERAWMSHEEKYNPKVLEGNWVERRKAIECPALVSTDWKTTYETDYKSHAVDSSKSSQIEAWDNKLNLEGLPKEILIDHNEPSENSWQTTYRNEYTLEKVIKPSKGT